MKKSILLVLTILSTATFLKAQDSIKVAVPKNSFHVFEFGVRFLPTVSAFDVQSSNGGTIKGEATLGFGVGAFLGVNFTKHVGVQGELLYSSLTQKYKENDTEHNVKLTYFNIPLLLSLNTDKSKPVNFNLAFGPQIGISQGGKLSSTQSGDSTSSRAILSLKKGDLGFAYGAGLDFGLNDSRTARLGIGFRGVYGLFDISDDSKTTSTDSYYVIGKTHINTYSAYVGLSIMF